MCRKRRTQEKKCKDDDENYFPSPLQDMIRTVLFHHNGDVTNASKQETEDNVHQFVANARKTWLIKAQYAEMIQLIGRVKAKYYNKKDWVDRRELSLENYNASIEQQRVWSKEAGHMSLINDSL